jgi:hypothetical protein
MNVILFENYKKYKKMSGYQKLKKENQFLNYTVKKLEAEMEFLSKNIYLRLNTKVANILTPYLIRSNLKKQIEEIVWRGETKTITINDSSNERYFNENGGYVNVVSEKEEEKMYENFIVKFEGIINKYKKDA